MIKPVTFQGASNFKASLYALEIKSRFINQNLAHGYYPNYGNELNAVVYGNTAICIFSGAFVIEGRMAEVITNEIVQCSPLINGHYGYVIAHLESYHPSDNNNCTFIIKTASSLEEINLIQEDINSAEADSINKIFEYPLYSFKIANNAVTELTKVIKKIDQSEVIQTIQHLQELIGENQGTAVKIDGIIQADIELKDVIWDGGEL